MTLARFAVLGLAMILAGCSVTSSTTASDENIQYTLKLNGCSTGTQTFKSKPEMCAGLKDDARNNYCARSLRKQKYQAECGGDFEEATPTPTPLPPATPTPNPTPRPTPLPTPAPEDPAIVKELRAEGIEVEVMSQDIGYPIPGELPFRVRLAKFWDVLASAKSEIVARKEWVKKLYLAEWAKYDAKDQQLTLTVDFTEETLPAYLTLLDRRLRLEAKTKLSYDFGIEVYDGKKMGDFDEFKKTLTALEIRGSKLMALTPLVERLKLDSYLSFYLRADERELTVSKDKFEADLDEATQKLAPLVPFASFAQAFKFTLKNGNTGDILEGTQGAHVFNAVAILNNEKAALTKLAKAGALKELEFSSMDYHYAENPGEIRVGGDEKALKTLSGVIRGLATEATRGAELGIEFKHYNYQLDEKFTETVKRFEARFTVIKARKDKIKTIRLNGYHSSYYSGSGELTIGAEDTLEDLDKVLKEIK